MEQDSRPPELMEWTTALDPEGGADRRLNTLTSMENQVDTLQLRKNDLVGSTIIFQQKAGIFIHCEHMKPTHTISPSKSVLSTQGWSNSLESQAGAFSITYYLRLLTRDPWDRT